MGKVFFSFKIISCIYSKTGHICMEGSISRVPRQLDGSFHGNSIQKYGNWISNSLNSLFGTVYFREPPSGNLWNRMTKNTDSEAASAEDLASAALQERFESDGVTRNSNQFRFIVIYMGHIWEMYGKYLVILELVGGDWNMNFIFPYMGNVIIPIDFHMFKRVETTNQF